MVPPVTLMCMIVLILVLHTLRIVLKASELLYSTECSISVLVDYFSKPRSIHTNFPAPSPSFPKYRSIIIVWVSSLFAARMLALLWGIVKEIRTRKKKLKREPHREENVFRPNFWSHLYSLPVYRANKTGTNSSKRLTVVT